MTELKKKRLELGLSQSQAAKLLDIPLSTLQKWDAGFLKCPFREIINLELRYLAANFDYPGHPSESQLRDMADKYQRLQELINARIDSVGAYN